MSEEPYNPSTGPEAGHDGEQKQTDEERLLEAIAKQKELIDALPSGDAPDEVAYCTDSSHSGRGGWCRGARGGVLLTIIHTRKPLESQGAAALIVLEERRAHP